MSKLVTNENLQAYHAELAEHIKLLQRGTAYILNDIVNYDGNTLKCTTAGTTATTKPDVSALDVGDTLPDGTAVWTRVDLDKRGIDYWASSTDYALNDQVVYNDKIYKCSTAHTSTSTFDDTKWAEISAGGGGGLDYWSSSTTYALDDVVIYNDKIYRCTTAHTSSSTFDDTKFTEISASISGGGSIDEWTSGTSYSSGDLVINNNVLYKANTTTSTTWVDSEWDVIGTTFNSTSTYAQKIITNVVAPYEMLLQVGDSNYCKPPIDVLKKTGGSDNVTLTLENYNNASAYTGTSDFLKIENSKAKLYNYKEYPITTQTLSTIDIGVSDEIDFDDFYVEGGGKRYLIDSNDLVVIHFNESVINETAYADPVVNSSYNIEYVAGKFDKGLYINDDTNANAMMISDNSLISAINSALNSDFTIEFWFKIVDSSFSGTSLSIFCGNGYGQLSFYIYNGTELRVGRHEVSNDYIYSVTMIDYMDENWHHFAFTRKNGNGSLFIDGTLVSQRSCSFYSTNTAFNVFCMIQYNTSTKLWNVDEFRFSNVCRYDTNFNVPEYPYSNIINCNITSLEVN